MDLRFTSEQERFRAEVRSWLEANAPSASKGTGPLPSLDTADGFEAHRAWERTMYDARLVGGVVARGVRRPGRRAPRVARSSRRSTTGPARPPGWARTASSSSPPPCSSSAPPSRRRAISPPWRRGRRSGARAGPSPTPAATSPPSAAGPRRRGDGGVGAQRAEDVVLARRLRRLDLRAVPFRPRGRAPPGPHLLPGADGQPRASRSGPSPSSTARPGSPRSSSRTWRSPTRRCSGAWARAGRWPWPRPGPSAACRCAARRATPRPPPAWSSSTAARPRPTRCAPGATPTTWPGP